MLLPHNVVALQESCFDLVACGEGKEEVVGERGAGELWDGMVRACPTAPEQRGLLDPKASSWAGC